MRHKKSVIQALLYSLIFCTARQFETGSRFGYYLSYQQYHWTAKNILTPWLSLKIKHFTSINHKVTPWNRYRHTGRQIDTYTNIYNKYANISNSNTQSTSTHKYTEYKYTQPFYPYFLLYVHIWITYSASTQYRFTLLCCLAQINITAYT